MSQQERSHNFSVPAPQLQERKRPTSERKIKANRQNALKSTGPKTPQGKSNSRKNSLKHGFYAKDLGTAFPLGIEDPRDFEKLHADLRNEWQPVGVSEDSEIEQIAVNIWRRRRQWSFENADFRLALLEAKRSNKRSNDDDDGVALRLLMNAEEQLETRGEILQELKEEIFAAAPSLREAWTEFEDISRSIAIEVEKGEQEAAHRRRRRSVTNAIPVESSAEKYDEQRMARFVGFQTVEFATVLLKRSMAFDEAVLNAQYRQNSIPSDDSLNRILRYSGMIDRELNRAFDRLERLQRRRKGDLVHPLSESEREHVSEDYLTR